MRDFRDAKLMAQTLRESLTIKAVSISHSESLELVSKMLGVSDWNTLSALLRADRRDATPPAAKFRTTTTSYPAIPIRDVVPFPAALFPLFVGREKTIRALTRAYEGEREMVLAIQRQAGIDEPRSEDVYEIGVLAQLLELQPQADGTITVLTRGLRRVLIRRFAMETGAFEAETADIDEDSVADATELVRRVVARFKDYAAAHGLLGPEVGLLFDQTREPGRIADHGWRGSRRCWIYRRADPRQRSRIPSGGHSVLPTSTTINMRRWSTSCLPFLTTRTPRR